MREALQSQFFLLRIMLAIKVWMWLCSCVIYLDDPLDLGYPHIGEVCSMRTWESSKVRSIPLRRISIFIPSHTKAYKEPFASPASEMEKFFISWANREFPEMTAHWWASLVAWLRMDLSAPLNISDRAHSSFIIIILLIDYYYYYQNNNT